MATNLDIVNMALSLVGDVWLTAFPDTSKKEGRYAGLFFQQALDEMISGAGVDWRIATDRAELAQVTDQPTFGWAYAYQLPSSPKSLRVISMLLNDEGNDEPLQVAWNINGQYLLTNESQAFILYMKQITQVGAFTPQMVNAASVLLASKLAVPLKGKSTDLGRILLEQYELVALPKAIESNNAENFVEGEAGEKPWTDAGRV